MTDHRVNLSLFFATDVQPGIVLSRVLSLLGPELTAVLAGTNASAFDLDDRTDETRAHVVVSPTGGTIRYVVDDEDAAIKHAKEIGGLLIELPVTEDYRTPTTPKEA